MYFKNVKSAITLKGGSYTGKTPNDIIEFPTVELKSALISIDQTKNIIKTDIEGRPGTVKEYISMSDHVVTISGIISGPAGVYPELEVLDLKNMLKAPVPIEVVCDHLNRWGIFYVVIESYSIPQEAGGISYQNFFITASEHMPTELIISE